jgi:hypothetical protein
MSLADRVALTSGPWLDNQPVGGWKEPFTSCLLMPTMISASIWFPIYSMLSAYYCIDRHPVLKSLVTLDAIGIRQLLLIYSLYTLSTACNIANVKVREASVFMLWSKLSPAREGG